MSCAWSLALRSMTWIPLRKVSSSCRVRRISAQPRITLSGVRSSCDSVARNSSFNAPSRSLSARASRSRSSNVCRSRAVCSEIASTEARADIRASYREVSSAMVRMQNVARITRAASCVRLKYSLAAVQTLPSGKLAAAMPV